MLASIAPAPVEAFRWPWSRNDPWPSSSTWPVVTLDHPRVETRFAATAATDGGYRFVVFGDQRALADGEWQEMVRRIVQLDREERAIAFILDTGDIVNDGSHTDQFHLLRRILRPAAHLPYLVGIGNHEVDNNRTPEARAHTTTFLAYLDDGFAPDRMWYRKDLGPATFLFLDTNDFVYGEDGERKACPLEVDPATREGRQLEWLQRELDSIADDPGRPTIVVMHHPLVQSSEKHREASCSLWNFSAGGRPLVDVLADGGVDVILSGHTHTYERFRMVRDDGREIVLVNLSGRPRDAWLWFGDKERRARDISGREDEWLEELGWLGLEAWRISQDDVMREDDEANQFAFVDVEADGKLFLQVHFMDDDAPGGSRADTRVRIH